MTTTDDALPEPAATALTLAREEVQRLKAELKSSQQEWDGWDEQVQRFVARIQARDAELTLLRAVADAAREADTCTEEDGQHTAVCSALARLDAQNGPQNDAQPTPGVAGARGSGGVTHPA